MSAAGNMASNEDICLQRVRDADSARYVATLFAPSEHRAALFALYAFNVEISDVAVHVSQPQAGEIRLQWWHDALSGVDHGDVAGHPVAAELRKALGAGVPVAPLLALIDAHRADLYADPMPSMALLHEYVDGAYGALFQTAAAMVGGEGDDVKAAAHHAGLAQGFAAIISALPLHAARGQIFLPADMLSAFGVSSEDILARRTAPALRALLGELRDQAQKHLDAAQAGLTQLPPAVRAVFLLLALTRATLAVLSKPDADPFAPKPLSRIHTLWLLWRAARKKDPSSPRKSPWAVCR